MGEKISMPGVIGKLMEITGYPQSICEDFLREFIAVITDTLKEGENVKIKGVGTFKLVAIDSRKSVDIATGNEIEIPGHMKVVFVPSKEIAEAVNAPFALFDAVEVGDNYENDEEEEESDEPIYVAAEEEEIEDEKPLPATESSVPADPEEDVAVRPESENVIDEIYDIPDKTSVTEEKGDLNHTAEAEAVEIASPKEPTASLATASEPMCETCEADMEPQTKEVAIAPDADDKKRKGQKTGYFKGFILGFVSGQVCLAIIIFILMLLLKDNFFGGEKSSEGNQGATLVENPVVPASSGDEESMLQDGDTERSSLSENVDTSPSDEIRYDTVTTTRFLTTLSSEYYGNFNFWPYIYEENKAILGHPNRIRPGTRVVIPMLSKYGVDASNPEDLAKAKRMGAEIYRRFNK